mgnify:CR=1 FL=1
MFSMKSAFAAFLCFAFVPLSATAVIEEVDTIIGLQPPPGPPPPGTPIKSPVQTEPPLSELSFESGHLSFDGVTAPLHASVSRKGDEDNAIEVISIDVPVGNRSFYLGNLPSGRYEIELCISGYIWTGEFQIE